MTFYSSGAYQHIHQDGVSWTHPNVEECHDGISERVSLPVDIETGSTISVDFTTKDSGAREEFSSGMVRDTQDGKPRFDLVFALGVPYKEQLFTRIAELMARGAEKYGDRNWEKADGDAELERARASAFRHFMQWFLGELDEDHAAAVFFNVNEVETIRYKQPSATASIVTMEGSR